MRLKRVVYEGIQLVIFGAFLGLIAMMLMTINSDDGTIYKMVTIVSCIILIFTLLGISMHISNKLATLKNKVDLIIPSTKKLTIQFEEDNHFFIAIYHPSRDYLVLADFKAKLVYPTVQIRNINNRMLDNAILDYLENDTMHKSLHLLLWNYYYDAFRRDPHNTPMNPFVHINNLVSADINKVSGYLKIKDIQG